MGLDPERITPAHELRDGLDYVPTHRAVLFGHHFASIAGLGPIVGPAIAVVWGWLPAVIWIIVGSIFIGGVHDIGCLFTSLRKKGRSVGDIIQDLVGRRARILFLLFIFFAMSLAMGVFALLVSKLFSPLPPSAKASAISVPEAVLPSFAMLGIAIIIGVLVYKYKVKLLPVSIVGFVSTLFFVWLGTHYPITSILGFELNPARWSYILLGYAFIASVLPVWLLLQPRDYINSFQLYFGMALLYLGLAIWHPPIAAPAVNVALKVADNPSLGYAPIFPLLFITVACGAVSGFHSLVASGTTSKQMDTEIDARLVGYGAMITEGALGVISVLACVVGLGALAQWQKHYPDMKFAAGNALSNYVAGASEIISKTGIIDVNLAKGLIATVAVGFALTTLDSATRLLRYNVEEIGKSINLPLLGNRFVAALIAISGIAFFAFLRVPHPKTGQPTEVAWVLWSLFGASNQLLAAFGLLTVTLFLQRLSKPTIYTAIPMILMFAVSIVALVMNLLQFWTQRNWILVVVGGAILVLAFWLAAESLMVFGRCWVEKWRGETRFQTGR